MMPEPTLAAQQPRALRLLLNVGHLLDHLFLLIFATAVGAVAREFGLARWEDLMPYGVGAFVLFGLGSIPAGRLGDTWGRRPMMLLFFHGIGAASLIVALAQTALQLAAALTLLGAFAAIYHPVGIPMLLQRAARPGATLGFNGLMGNLGIALAALLTGWLVELAGWRAAFVVPALASFGCGLAFARLAPRESEPPAQRTERAPVPLERGAMLRTLLIMSIASASAGLIFNLTTNGNTQLLQQRLRGLVDDPSTIGALLALVYAAASLMQLLVGRLIDRFKLKPLQFVVVAAQVPLLALAAHAQGWWLFALLLLVMAVIFGNVPFVDATLVRYVDDRVRSRVAGVRLAISLTISSSAVWALGPAVKSAGFPALFFAMALIAAVAALAVLGLPAERQSVAEHVATRASA